MGVCNFYKKTPTKQQEQQLKPEIFNDKKSL